MIQNIIYLISREQFTECLLIAASRFIPFNEANTAKIVVNIYFTDNSTLKKLHDKLLKVFSCDAISN